uniref:C-type lectin domain-containing protein n=1 Tax=Hucho hucho TaxID=62062 RepID=A0A4W5R228_9TELE
YERPVDSGRTLYRMVAVSFGMLCVVQVTLNISLRLVCDYNNLTEERDQLQTSYNNPTVKRDKLQTSWQKFESSWYFLSTETKTWNKSRADCLERGADLVIINSDKEQEFLFNFNKRVWIGLTDRETEGNWKWVDGTTLTIKYWYKPQPDNGGGQADNAEEDCVEIRNDEISLKAWNDLLCDSKLHWICEKVV